MLELIGTVYYDDVSWVVLPAERLTDDFRESNRGRHTWFVTDLDEFRTKLSELSQPRR